MLEKIYRRFAENKYNSLFSREEEKKEQIIEGVLQSFENTDLLDIKGVGEETARKLFENKIYSQEDVIKNVKAIENISLPLLGKKALEKFINEKI